MCTVAHVRRAKQKQQKTVAKEQQTRHGDAEREKEKKGRRKLINNCHCFFYYRDVLDVRLHLEPKFPFLSKAVLQVSRAQFYDLFFFAMMVNQITAVIK